MIGCSALAQPIPPTDVPNTKEIGAEREGENAKENIDQSSPEQADGLDVRLGTGRFTNPDAKRPTRPEGSAGKATFNFEGENVHAVTKAILGDLLKQNYVMAPGVQGTVTLVAESVDADQALSLLEMVLGWNNLALVRSDGRYNVVPVDRALSGNLVPIVEAPTLTRGYQVRAVPLKFVSANEMEKILKPYARDRAIVHVDPSRNMLVLAGTSAEIANYLHTIDTFDVDWLEGMSVGTFRLSSANAEKLVEQLERLLGEDSKTPMAGMVRLMPIEGANSILAISSQPKYLKDVKSWIEKLDAGGEGARLYTYEAKYLKATDLGEKLTEIFSGTSARKNGGSSVLAPGMEPITLSSVSSSASKRDDAPNAEQPRLLGKRERRVDTGVSLGAGEVSVTSIEESNSLMIRASPAQWEAIQLALTTLDTMPLQVHIEAQIVEVVLQGDLEYGVSWFFENAIDNEDGLRDAAAARKMWGSISGAVSGAGGSWTWLGRNALATIKMLDRVSNIRVLSTPSVLVRNNIDAELNVGQNIPVTTTSFNPVEGGAGSGTGTFTNVQYLKTGVILKVKPRVSSEGMVFLEINQEISSPASEPTSEQPNVAIATKNLKTEAAVRSGETVMLAGLINENQGRGRSGIPYLSRIPLIGGAFGTQARSSQRTEVLIFITPKVIRDPAEATQRTMEYSRRFRALQPLEAIVGEGP